MKRVIVIFFMLPAGVAFAQMSFGIKAGMNINNIHTNLPEGFGYSGTGDGIDPNLGFHIGVFTKVDLSKKFAFIPELQYIKKGFTMSDSDIRINLNYMELPLMFSYSPIKWIGVELGPGIAYRLAAKAHVSGHSADRSDVYDKKVDMSLNAGVRIYASQKLSMGVRYSYGLISTDDTFFTEDGIHGETYSEYHRNVLLSVYYSLFNGGVK